LIYEIWEWGSGSEKDEKNLEKVINKVCEKESIDPTLRKIPILSEYTVPKWEGRRSNQTQSTI
jgi:hypothetical protein